MVTTQQWLAGTRRTARRATPTGGYGLCQWEDEVDGEFLGRLCYRRTTGVYCHMHDRRLKREQERRRKAKAEAEVILTRGAE